MCLENGTKHFETLHMVLSHDVSLSLSVVIFPGKLGNNIKQPIVLLFCVSRGFNECTE